MSTQSIKFLQCPRMSIRALLHKYSFETTLKLYISYT